MLTSLKNPKVAAAIRLKKRAYRERERHFLVEGTQAITEALAVPGALKLLFTADPLDPVAVRAREHGIDVVPVSADLDRKLTSTVTPQGLVGISPYRDVGVGSLPDSGCVAVLHEVRDPGNAGTVMRSADAAGASAVVFSATSVDVYNPKTVRASAGSIFHLPFARGITTTEAVIGMHDKGFRVVAMDPHADVDLFSADLSGSIALLFGNEARGLPSEIVALTDGSVRVPHAGRAESLNLAAAASVCLFEWSRRSTSPQENLSAIVAAVAHDIRSPLTAIKGFGFALEKRAALMNEEQRTMMLRGIVHDADRMDAIVRQLLDAARLVSGSFEWYPERTDVSELVLSIQEYYRVDPEHPALIWEGEPLSAFVDPARLSTIIMAFTESLVWWGREGAIRLSARLEEDCLVIEAVRDGSELPADSVEDLFTPRRPGSGAGSKIGLFVAREVARSRGGDAYGTVERDRLTFRLRLPVAGQAPAPPLG